MSTSYTSWRRMEPPNLSTQGNRFPRAVLLANYAASVTGFRMRVAGVYRKGKWIYLAVLATSKDKIRRY